MKSVYQYDKQLSLFPLATERYRRRLFPNQLVALMCWSAICFVPLAAHANGAAGGARETAQLDFKVVIPTIIKVKALQQPEGITIRQSHIERGYIDLDAATSLLLTSNSRHGFMLAANFDSGLLTSVEVRIVNHILHAAGDLTMMRIASPVLADALLGVSYRLHLKPGVRAGEYRWPVALTFMPHTL